MKMVEVKSNDGVYVPSEDSMLLEKAVRNYAFGKTLDMGTGSGVLGIAAAQKGCTVVFADINPNAVECARANAERHGVTGTFVQSDMFNQIKGKFNTIIFNPPYLPPDGAKQTDADTATYGGINGRETIDLFLKEYKSYVEEEHVVLLLESSFNAYESDVRALKAEIIERARYFFEELVVLKFR